MRSLDLLLLVVLALALALSGSAAASAPLQPVRLQLKWTHQFQFAGYYAAEAQGYYRAAGLDVSFLEARPDQDPVAEVLRGNAEFGVGTSDLLLRRARGQPVVVLCAVFQHSPLALMALAGSGIRNIHEVAGKRLMIEDNSAELFAYLDREGVPRGARKLLPHTFSTAELADGRVDAMSVYTTDEPFVFAKAGVDYALFTPRSGGIDFYGDNLFTTEAMVRDHPELVAAFRAASLRGWDYTMAHPQALVDLIGTRYPHRKGREQLLFEHAQMVPLMRTDLVPVGFMYPGRWRHIADVFAELGMLQANFPFDGFLYDPDTRRIPPWVYWSIGGVLALAGITTAVALYILRINRQLSHESDRRQRTESSLAASRQHYRLIYETAPLALIVFDREQCVTDWNHAAERIFGWPKHEMLGIGLERMVPTDELHYVRTVMERAWDGGLVGGINRNLTRDGRTILCRWTNVLQRDGGGNPISVLAVAEDITETERIRIELESTNRALQSQLERIEGLQEELREQALRDPLTGLYNRRYLRLVLERGLANRTGLPLSLAMIDIDRFKEVNDTLGHPCGDQVLVALAQLLSATTRGEDVVCRYGGEEFVVVLPGAEPPVAYERAESWRRAFAELAVHCDGGAVRRTLSVGIATWPIQSVGGAPELIALADRALYAAKQGGRNRTAVAG